MEMYYQTKGTSEYRYAGRPTGPTPGKVHLKERGKNHSRCGLIKSSLISRVRKNNIGSFQSKYICMRCFPEQHPVWDLIGDSWHNQILPYKDDRSLEDQVLDLFKHT